MFKHYYYIEQVIYIIHRQHDTVMGCYSYEHKYTNNSISGKCYG